MISTSVDKNTLVGKKFRVKTNNYPNFSTEEILEVTRIDSDGDIIMTGADDYYYIRSISKLNKDFELYVPEFDTQWIVWNEEGSVMATSEEDAKTKAEELLHKGFKGPVYIAKAMQKAEINRVVWSN